MYILGQCRLDALSTNYYYVHFGPVQVRRYKYPFLLLCTVSTPPPTPRHPGLDIVVFYTVSLLNFLVSSAHYHHLSSQLSHTVLPWTHIYRPMVSTFITFCAASTQSLIAYIYSAILRSPADSSQSHVSRARKKVGSVA